MVALAGRLTTSDLSAHCGADLPQLLRTLQPALSAEVVQIAEHVEFTHPLLAAAVRDDTPTNEQRRIHLQLAAYATTAENRARHRALGAGRPSGKVAAELESAARQAAQRGAAAAELELLTLAVDATPASQATDRNRRRLLAAEAALRCGHTRLGHDWLIQVAAEPAGCHAADALALLARIAWLEGPAHEVVLHGDAALAAAGDARKRAEIDVQLAQLSRHDRHAGLAHACRALELTVGDDSPGAMAVRVRALVARLDVESDMGRPVDLRLVEELLTLQPEIGPGRVADHPRYYLATIFLQHDLLDRTRLLLEECDQVAQRRGDEGSRTAVDDQRAQLELLAGDWSAARLHARRQAHTAALCEQKLQELWGRQTLALLDLREGRTGAADAVTRVLRLATECADPMTETFALVAWAEERRLAGEPSASRRALHQVDDISHDIGVRSPNAFRHGPDLVECLAAEGNLSAAQRRLDELTEQVETAGLPWARAATARAHAAVLAGQGRSDEAVDVAAAAAQHAAGVGIPFEHGRCLLTLSTVHRRRRSKAAAATAVDQACSTFDSLGARPWSEVARKERSRLGLRLATSQILTSTERLVAELAATGATNPEISARLSMSRKTVEFNLSKVYRKLDVRNRTQLPSRLSQL